ncbi:MAG: hypothetical protein LBQ65_02565 [Tannerellaceae bacterium]|jgi:hypothetical protein|nr:hypothetical protein [Tannerellaceae bacterium]
MSDYKKKKKIGIVEPVNNNKIDKEKLNEDNYPIFCFKYLSDVSIKDCKNPKFFRDFLMKLQKLSELGWNGIRTSHRHAYGLEPIPIGKIKPQVLPESITPEVEYLHAFRASGNNLPFVGIQMQKIFRILFIEAHFGDIYNH